MGLFSSKKKVYVSSSVYNLAGAEEDRIQYLPSVVVTKIVSDSKFSLSDAVTSALQNGPGMRLRRFARWARDKQYASSAGQMTSSLRMGDSINVDQIIQTLPKSSGETISIQKAEIKEADFSYWADRWLLANLPNEVNGDYTIDYLSSTNTLYITFADGRVYSHTPTDFDITAQYLYAGYVRTTGVTRGPLVQGETYTVPSRNDYPDTSTWTLNSNVSTPTSQTLTDTVETVTSYSDGRPSETTTSASQHVDPYTHERAEYEKTEYKGLSVDGSSTQSMRYVQTNETSAAVQETVTTTTSQSTLADGTVATTTTTETVQSLALVHTYRVDTQEISNKGWSPPEILIYKRNSGNATLDAMFVPDEDSGQFLPFIPLRYENRFLSDTHFGTIHNLNYTAIKKALDTEYGTLIDRIAETPSLGDIDHVYAVFGVSLNTKDHSSRKYIYKFFQAMIEKGAGGADGHNSWRTQWNEADISQKSWESWKEAQADINNPMYGQPEPVRIPYPAVPVSSIQIRSWGPYYDVTIGWSALLEETFTGLGKADAKQGHLWFVPETTVQYTERWTGGEIPVVTEVVINRLKLYWQDSPNTYRVITVQGLYHNNVIHRGKSVRIQAHEALADPEDSGFIIPLHEGVFRAMSLKDATQLATASSHLVFNTYKVVKTKWYQSGWFKVVLIIAIIVISIMFPPAGAAAAGVSGVLGTAAAVGAALGAAGTMALVLGSIANIVAGMILSQIIMKASVALFGEKVGTIVGTIASVIALNVGTSMATGNSMATSISDLGRADNLLKLTVAAGDGYTQYLQTGVQEVMEKTQGLLTEYGIESSRIEDLWEQNLGYGINVLDPLALINVSSSFKTFIPETTDSFLARTLMTGSEIADMTNGMLTNFASYTLSTELLA